MRQLLPERCRGVKEGGETADRGKKKKRSVREGEIKCLEKKFGERRRDAEDGKQIEHQWELSLHSFPQPPFTSLLGGWGMSLYQNKWVLVRILHLSVIAGNQRYFMSKLNGDILAVSHSWGKNSYYLCFSPFFFQFDFFSHWTRWTLCAPPLHLIWNIVNNWHVTFPASPYIPSSTFPFLSPLAASPPPLQNRHSAMGLTAYLLHKGSIMDARAQWYCCHTSLQPCV